MEHQYPPKNRVTDSSDLGVLDIEVVSALGAERFDPNTIIFTAFAGYLAQLPSVPDIVSDISGEPALVYRTQQVNLYLTPGELHRIVMRSLAPAEMFALRAKYGDFFEIHADFYDARTGEALQPKD